MTDTGFVAATLIDGDPVPAEYVNAMAYAVQASSAVLVDSIRLTTNPILPAGAFATETEIDGMLHIGPMIAGRPYSLVGQIVRWVTNTDTETELIARWGTALTGRELGRVRLGVLPATGRGSLQPWSLDFVADATSPLAQVHWSIIRTAGSGTTTLEGGEFSRSAIHGAGISGTVRTV